MIKKSNKFIYRLFVLCILFTVNDCGLLLLTYKIFYSVGLYKHGELKHLCYYLRRLYIYFVRAKLSWKCVLCQHTDRQNVNV